jgi:hypothetical protein
VKDEDDEPKSLGQCVDEIAAVVSWLDSLPEDSSVSTEEVYGRLEPPAVALENAFKRLRREMEP